MFNKANLIDRAIAVNLASLNCVCGFGTGLYVTLSSCSSSTFNVITGCSTSNPALNCLFSITPAFSTGWYLYPNLNQYDLLGCGISSRLSLYSSDIFSFRSPISRKLLLNISVAVGTAF